MKRLLVSTDPILIDTACTKLLGYSPEKVTHVKLGAGLNLGTMDLSAADVRSLKLA